MPTSATANVSSSSVISRPDALRVDLAAAGLLPPLPQAYLAGRDLDLLAPLRFLAPGAAPSGPALPGSRRELAEALAIANRGYGNPRADDLARRLADPATRVVVTGQQPGLLGGPLYAFSKMVAASRWAAALEAQGEPAVAVFWVATEDHDWAEISTATVLAPGGPRTFDLGADPEPLTPVGMRALGPRMTDLLRELAEAVPGERYPDWVRALGQWYRPDARFGEAFCRLMAHLLGPHCPLLLDAMNPVLKSAQRPWLQRLVELRREIEDALIRRDGEIEARGYPLQVSPQRGVSPLFLLSRGERRRIEWHDGNRYALRGREEGGAVGDLLQIADENPGVLSPGVLARPAVQDAVLGTFIHLLGPGELSYIGQAAAVHEALEVESPWVALRPQTLVVEPHQVDKLAEVGVPLSALLGSRPSLDRALAELENGDLVAPVRRRIEQALADLHTSDPNLERPVEKTREQILRALDTLGEKATTAAARRNEVRNRRVDQLRESFLPLDKPQERVVAAAHFHGKYGDRFVGSYWEQMDLDPRELQVVIPEGLIGPEEVG
ncbi:MAG TPA: bacillithiol biosynthesis cysteine-adding enzyme BshC [Thermoanaerobaculia bacterium]|nr:bacillithiol biosynthesis cysteine-adding enzyme BshC [Thermoanaerobaculia bacterium]